MFLVLKQSVQQVIKPYDSAVRIRIIRLMLILMPPYNAAAEQTLEVRVQLIDGCDRYCSNNDENEIDYEYGQKEII